MSKIITEPTVTIIATSGFQHHGFGDFCLSDDVNDAYCMSGTPLQKIADIALRDNRREFTHEELIPEFAGRFCYRSWEKGRETPEYIENILDSQHGSVLEHSSISFAISGVSRSLTHELIRHRVGIAISQESQRYVDAKDVNFVVPPLMLYFVGYDTDAKLIQDWFYDNKGALAGYEELKLELEGLIIDETSSKGLSEKAKVKEFTRLKKRATEAARSLLPNDAETRLLWTANLRTLRHFIMTRGAEPADLEIRRLAVEVAKACKLIAPTVFNDITITEGEFNVGIVNGEHWKV